MRVVITAPPTLRVVDLRWANAQSMDIVIAGRSRQSETWLHYFAVRSSRIMRLIIATCVKLKDAIRETELRSA